ncbi:hypothetical protein CVT26_004393 [Gymnopilus dilepis]|uniref:Uncharacterized protein n=1 Tax=Gymnopilus dilepis TaxID=231916 RepID=A0A409WY15_9AGAR|nr:hypothetical protein CVT26_004393 [Gymnopilus dilepis]
MGRPSSVHTRLLHHKRLKKWSPVRPDIDIFANFTSGRASQFHRFRDPDDLLEPQRNTEELLSSTLCEQQVADNEASRVSGVQPPPLGLLPFARSEFLLRRRLPGPRRHRHRIQNRIVPVPWDGSTPSASGGKRISKRARVDSPFVSTGSVRAVVLYCLMLARTSAWGAAPTPMANLPSHSEVSPSRPSTSKISELE